MKLIRTRAAAFALSGCAVVSNCGSSGDSAVAVAAAAAAPKIGHVFVLVLENKNYADSFDPNGDAPYLANDLPAMGQLLRQYYGIGHPSGVNYIAMVSGQAPNDATQASCHVFSDFQGTTTPDANGQVTGEGCVYPAAIKMIGDQLEAAGLSWRGYMEDMGNDLARDGSATCAHPPLNGEDYTHDSQADDLYAARHNPFINFHSLIDHQARCDAHVVPLTALPADLQHLASTPNYVFITPNMCNDGHDTNCVNGEPGGLTSINTFLQLWVPRILASPAFRQDGLLIVTFDEARDSDTRRCCNEPTGPNVSSPGITGPGGGRTGAVLISPFIEAGTVNDTPYNHYSMLRSVEDLFGVPHLGYAGQAGLQAFGTDVWGQDSDLDGVSNSTDNCTERANPDQRDTNVDGYGNACDGDLDDSEGTVNFADLALFRAAFGTASPDADFDGNGGSVNFADLATFRGLFGKPPGPSGLAPP